VFSVPSVVKSSLRTQMKSRPIRVLALMSATVAQPLLAVLPSFLP
jgi:hypothetical protein